MTSRERLDGLIQVQDILNKMTPEMATMVTQEMLHDPSLLDAEIEELTVECKLTDVTVPHGSERIVMIKEVRRKTGSGLKWARDSLIATGWTSIWSAVYWMENNDEYKNDPFSHTSMMSSMITMDNRQNDI